MEYTQNQYVIYNGAEICRIGEKVRKCFDGKNENEYYTLSSKDSKSTYYIPAEKIDENVRPLMTKKQILKVVDSLPYVEAEWTDDRNERKLKFSDAIRNGDYSRILPMVSGIWNEKAERAKKGKHLLNDDRRNFELAKKLLHTEISFLFNISIDEAEEFIQKRIQKNQL